MSPPSPTPRDEPVIAGVAEPSPVRSGNRGTLPTAPVVIPSRRVMVTVIVALAAVGGCVPAPPSSPLTVEPPAQAHPVVAVAARAEAVAPALRAASVERVARQLTVRVRSRGCGRLGTASAVAVGPRLLVTNRHVVDGAETIELNYWDGTSARADLTAVAVADDLALVRVSIRLPAVAHLADTDPHDGTNVSVVGYPNGGAQTIERGEVIEYARLRKPTDASPVMRLSAPIAPGNSGGAVVNAAGDVVGVVFGVETETDYGLAIPVSAVRDLLADGGSPPTPGCG